MMLSGQLLSADSTLKQALSEALEDQAARADVLNNLGQLAWRRKSYGQGRTWLSEALKLDISLHDKRGEASALHYLGLILLADGDRIKAASCLEQAAKTRIDLGLREDAADSLYALANLQLEQGNGLIARDLAEQSLTLLESVRAKVPTPDLRAAFYSNKRRVFDLLLEIAMASAGPSTPAEGLLQLERGKARALLDLLSEGSVLRQLAPSQLEHRVGIQRRIDLLLAQLSSAPIDQQDGLRRRLEMVFAEDTEGEAQVREALANLKLGVPLPSVEQFQRWIPSDTAVLEFHLGDKNGYAWLIRANGIRVFPLPARSLIEPIVSRTVDLFGDVLGRQRSSSQEANFERGMQQLSSLLLGYLRNVPLPGRLIIIPDGALHRVPFAALFLPGTTKSLGLVHELLQAPGAGYLMDGRKPRPLSSFPRSILAIADPVFSSEDPRVKLTNGRGGAVASSQSTLGRLPFRTDVDTLLSLIPSARRTILSGFDANTIRLREENLEQFGVLYFSSHAIIDDRTPELSRIALSQVDSRGRSIDGFLRPYHLAQFHLSGSVVILSGCETALGKQVFGEGLAGFTSGLFAAGAAQLVLSLNSVDAEGTSRFFSEMFQHYLSPKAPESIERSLLLARRAMASSARWSDPYYWAAFVVVGPPADVAQPARTLN
jgi:CHAT domain-containing protein